MSPVLILWGHIRPHFCVFKGLKVKSGKWWSSVKRRCSLTTWQGDQLRQVCWSWCPPTMLTNLNFQRMWEQLWHFWLDKWETLLLKEIPRQSTPISCVLSIELLRRIRRQMMTQLPDVLMMSAAIVNLKSNKCKCKQL